MSNTKDASSNHCILDSFPHRLVFVMEKKASGDTYSTLIISGVTPEDLNIGLGVTVR